MEIYLKFIDFHIWDINENGLGMADKNNCSLNVDAMNVLISTLDKFEFNHISHCLIAQEIQSALDAKYGRKIDNCKEFLKADTRIELHLTGFTKDHSNDDGEDRLLVF